MTNDRIRQLKRANIGWTIAFIAVCILLYIVLFVSDYREIKLKAEIADLKTRIPEWTLKVSCYDETETGRVEAKMTYTFKDYHDYLDELNNLPKGCEVIE